MLTIHLMGPLQLMLDGQPVGSFRSSKALALFVYLAHTGQPHPREVLADLLWDSSSTKQALSNLRTVLTQLRPKLGDYILSDGSTLAFNGAQPHLLDTAVVRTELAAMPNALTPMTAARLEEALQTVRGDFLEDFVVRHAPRFNDWALIERERLHRHILTASQQLAHYFLAAHDLPAAIRAANRWLAFDALNEAAHRLLLQALALSGQRRAALQQYDTCVALLDAELGVLPEEATAALAEQIRAGELTAPLTAASVPDTAVPTQTIAVPTNTAVAHNLQFTPFTFFGRAAEQADTLTALQAPHIRLLTITGAGGMGKTRLALSVIVHALDALGDQFTDGLYFLPLAALETTDEMLAAIAAALNLKLQPSSAQPLADQICAHLQPLRLLLALDNVEHLLGGGARALVQTLLAAAPGLTLLLTSREPLDLPEETVLPLTGWTLPLDTAVALNAPAALLFQQAARRVQPAFSLTPADTSALRHLCRWLMGMPLALEMAGAWADTLSLTEMVSEVEQNVDFLEALQANVPDRQRSLRAVFNYSWQRLSPAEQALWPRLALFRDGFTYDAAHAALGASRPLLAHLVKKALLQFDRQQERYSLHSLLRQFGQAKLADDAVAAGQEALAAYYCRWLQEQLPALHGGAQQQTARALLRDWQNIRRAWFHAAKQQQVDWLAAAIEPFNHFCLWRGTYTEAVSAMQSALDAIGADESAAGLELRAMLLLWQSVHAFELGQLRQQSALVLQADALLSRPALPPGTARFARAFLRREQGKQWRRTDPDRAEAAYEESRQLFHDLGQTWQEAITLAWLGDVVGRRHDWPRLAQITQKMLALQERLDDRRGMSFSLLRLANLAQQQNDLRAAERQTQRALAMVQALGETRLVSQALFNLGTIRLRGGDFATAESLLQESQALMDDDTYNHVQMKDNLNMLGFVALWQQDFVTAEQYFRQALAVGRQDQVASTVADSAGFLGMAHLLAGRIDNAVESLERAAQTGQDLQARNRRRWANWLGLAHLHAGAYDRAAELAAVSPARSDAGPLQLGLLAVADADRPLSERQVVLHDQVAAFQQRGDHPLFPDLVQTLGMAAISAAHLQADDQGWLWGMHVLQEAVAKRQWLPLLYGLCAAARLQANAGSNARAAVLLGVLETFPLVNQSCWFRTVVVQPIETAVAALPAAQRAAHRAQGERQDLWQTAEALLAALT